jgi:hypothetical protein
MRFHVFDLSVLCSHQALSLSYPPKLLTGLRLFVLKIPCAAGGSVLKSVLLYVYTPWLDHVSPRGHRPHMGLESPWMKEGRLDETNGRIGAISVLVLFQTFSVLLLTGQFSATTAC